MIPLSINQEFCLLEYNAVEFGESRVDFRRATPRYVQKIDSS
jgi:hypothetical protein